MHAIAPCSACALAQARPTMSYIPLVFTVRLYMCARDLALPPDPWAPKGSKYNMYIPDITSDESYNHWVCKFSNNVDVIMFVYKLSNN